ncbi:MAG: hypothetical protein ACR2H4_04710 [Pyrinomonadaceae bacterium]
MRRFLAALALTVLVSVPAFAGEIPTMGTPQPPPPPTASSAILGDIPSGDIADSLSDAAISALLTALGLASI